MPSLARLAVLASLAIAPVLACASQTARTERSFRDGVLVSPALPALRFRPDPAFRYLGRVPIRIDDIAAGERHIFGDVDGKRVRRLLILQFEGFLPDVKDEYRYQLRNPVVIAGDTYGHGTFVFSHAAARREGPGREVDSTTRFLARAGYEVPDEQLTSRFARILGESRRDEFLIFYQEAAEPQGLTMARIAPAGSFVPEYAWLADSLKARSLRAFRIER